MIRISVIIPNFNGERYIENCLRSVLLQTFLMDEIIVVDNGSFDKSCELIENKFPEVKLIRLTENTGFSCAVNIGIRHASGKYMLLLNNDTEIEEMCLNNLLSCFETDDKIFSVSSKMIRYNERNIIDDAGDQLTIIGWAYKRGDGECRYKSYLKTDEIFSSCGGAALYRRDIINQIGNLDEKFFAYLEDVDLGFRARIHGYKNIYCPDAIVYHVGSATSGSQYNPFKIANTAKNTVLLFYKNMPWWLLAINLPFFLIGFITKLFFFLKRGFIREYTLGTLRGFLLLQQYNYNRPKMAFVKWMSLETLLILNFYRYAIIKIQKYNKRNG